MKRRGHVDKEKKSMRVKETLILAAWNNAIGTNSIGQRKVANSDEMKQSTT